MTTETETQPNSSYNPAVALDESEMLDIVAVGVINTVNCYRGHQQYALMSSLSPEVHGRALALARRRAADLHQHHLIGGVYLSAELVAEVQDRVLVATAMVLGEAQR